MEPLSTFEQLVATEAAVRLEFVYRCQVVMLNNAYGLEEYSVANPDQGSNRETVADNLSKTFVRIYDYAFEDSSQHHKVVGGKVCNTRDLTFENRAKLREIFQNFADKTMTRKANRLFPLNRARKRLKRSMNNSGTRCHCIIPTWPAALYLLK
jgi:transcriptional regulator of heat shock response